MMGGILTEGIDMSMHDPDGLGSQVFNVIKELRRDGLADDVIKDKLNDGDMKKFCAELSSRLGLRIGGRYVPKMDYRAARDASVWKAFNGRNHAEVMKQFSISRRLLYSILARQRKF